MKSSLNRRGSKKTGSNERGPNEKGLGKRWPGLLWIYVGAGVLIGLALLWVIRPRKSDRNPALQAAMLGHHPPGTELNYAGARHPGDLAKGRKQLLKLYEAILAYRKRHAELPATWVDLEKDQLITEGDLKNDDVAYSDEFQPGAFNQFLMWETRSPRPNGSPKPATPGTGECDVWLVSSLYLRHAGRAPDGRDHGAYLVLYSDGSLDEVPLDRVMMVPQNGNSRIWDEVMPRQTGIPRNAVTYASYSRRRGLRGG